MVLAIRSPGRASVMCVSRPKPIFASFDWYDTETDSCAGRGHKMRRDRIIKAVNTLKDALQAAQIRELLRAARNGQQAEGVNRTQKILLAYNVFMRHYQEFAEDEKDMMAFFGLTPLLDLAFWPR